MPPTPGCDEGEEPSKLLSLPMTRRRRRSLWGWRGKGRRPERFNGKGARRLLFLLPAWLPRKMQLLALLWRLFLGHGFTSNLSWRTLEDLSIALSKTSAGKSSVDKESLALQRSMKDSKEIESFTFASNASCLLRTKLASIWCQPGWDRRQYGYHWLTP